MWPLWLIAAAIFIGIRQTDPELVEIKPKSVFAFLKFMFWVTLIRVCIFNFNVLPDQSNTRAALDLVGLWHLFGVYWEDVFFTLPILYWAKKGLSKWFLIPYMLVVASVFAAGHMYQGGLWAAITLVYVPYISYKYSKTVGLGTVAICHILYDVITFLTMKVFF